MMGVAHGFHQVLIQRLFSCHIIFFEPAMSGERSLRIHDPHCKNPRQVIMSGTVRFRQVNNELKGLISSYVASGTLANGLGGFLGIKDQIFHPYRHKRKIGLINVIGIPVVPQMGETSVVIFSLISKFYRDRIVPIAMRGHLELGTLLFSMLPLGRICIFAHTLKPCVGVPNRHDRQYPILVDRGRFLCGMLKSNFSRGMLAPRHLPSHAV
jgi:hypothetical protein